MSRLTDKEGTQQASLVEWKWYTLKSTSGLAGEAFCPYIRNRQLHLWRKYYLQLQCLHEATLLAQWGL